MFQDPQPQSEKDVLIFASRSEYQFRRPNGTRYSVPIKNERNSHKRKELPEKEDFEFDYDF